MCQCVNRQQNPLHTAVDTCSDRCVKVSIIYFGAIFIATIFVLLSEPWRHAPINNIYTSRKLDLQEKMNLWTARRKWDCWNLSYTRSASCYYHHQLDERIDTVVFDRITVCIMGTQAEWAETPSQHMSCGRTHRCRRPRSCSMSVRRS